MGTEGYVTKFNDSIKELLRDALALTVKNPAQAAFVLRSIKWQQQAAERRLEWRRKGLQVPAFIIASITNRCNLQCKGCYARAQHRELETEMSDEKLKQVLREASDLGISIALLAGGEPLMRQGLLEITRQFPEMIFPVFTNGLLIDTDMVSKLRRQPNVIPVISLEGHHGLTDQRRGQGVFQHLQGTMDKLKGAGIFFGTSLTVTSENYPLAMGDAYVEELLSLGCRLFFYVEYVPVQPGTDRLVLSIGQSKAVPQIMAGLRNKFPGLFIAFPGDEEAFGGCLAAGRGFVHISPSGRLEPCPFAPYSDARLEQQSLRDALASPLLAAIREQHSMLTETTGGCVLWDKREWVQSLLVKINQS